ncbi:MAG: hypothetical protein ACFLMY_05870 [Candidatus Brachytrichaceae bacterium NZ_4S206]|jgi:hypothetical protein
MSALTSLLVRDGVVPVRKIEEALQRQVISGGDVETVLLEMGAVPENVLASYRASLFGLPPASHEEVMSAPHEVVALVPADVATAHRVVPLALRGSTLEVAVREPLRPEDEERLGFLLGHALAQRVACDVRIAAGLAYHYGVELPPRFTRLLERMRRRDPGAVAAVEAAGPRLATHASEIPYKDAVEDAPSPFERRTKPFAEPLRPRRNTAPGTGDPAPHRLEEPLPDVPRAPVASLPEDDELDEPTARELPYAEPVPLELPSSMADAPASSKSGALRLVRGPVTLAAGERLLKRASDRDQILEILVSFARQFFDYTALFVVQEDAADGREAWGLGASTEALRAISVPLDRPSVFAEARRTRAPQVRRLGTNELEREVAASMRRPQLPTALVLPIAIRQRVVLMVYGDRDGEDFDLGAVMELVRFGSRVVEAFEQLILRRKRVGYQAGDAEREARGSLKRAARAMAETAGRSRPDPAQRRREEGDWKPGRRASLSDDSWASVAKDTPTTVLPAATQAPLVAETGAIGGEAPIVEPEPPAPLLEPVEPEPDLPPHRPDAPPSEVLGIARREPPPPPQGVELADIDLAASELAAAVAAAEAELAEAEDEPELIVDAPADDDDDDDLDELEDVEEPPPPRARPEGTYSIQHAAVDVVRPARASDRPPRPASQPPVRRPTSDPPRRPAEGAARAPRGLDADTRSVIVDMGEQVHAQVEDLLAATTEEQRAVRIRGLLQLGEASLPALVQAFPGPLKWDRNRSSEPPPPGRDISVVARALVAFGERAVPYVASLLGSGHPDVRYYAGLLVAELIHPELMGAVAARVYDSDAGVRRLACALLPRFAGYRDFEEIRTTLRRTARLRGKVASRRWQAVDALAALRDVDGLDRLVELLREQDDELVDHVHRALVVLTAADHGRSYRKWAGWFEKHGGEHRIEWLIEGLLHSDEPIRAMAAAELERLTLERYGFQAGAPKKDRERVHKRYREWWEDEGRRRYGPG